MLATLTNGGMFVMLENLISLICEELGCDETNVSGETLLGELVSDDIEIEELVLALENKFDVELGDEICGDISVADLAEMIE